MSTVFTEIIEGRVPAHVVAEDSCHIAFLDIYPAVFGHTLVVPKKETGYFFDLSDEEMASLIVFAKRVGGALEDVVVCRRVALLVLGLEVPHVHVHLLPVDREGDLVFGVARGRACDGDLGCLARRVRRAFLSC